MTIDSTIDQWFQPASDAAGAVVFYGFHFAGHDIKIILLWLAFAALFFTVYMGFVNFRYFGHAINVVRGKYDKDSDDGQINSFQALMASLSGTVGLGNIAGVAIAITTGGPGAVVWMVLMGFFSMATKFSEVTMGVKYRHKLDPDNLSRLSGGPMFYLRDGFRSTGIPYLGSALAIIYAVCCLGACIGGGNMFQANQAYLQFYNITGGETGFLHGYGWLFGLVLSVLTGVVIFGGIKSIANTASRIVPFMGILYVITALVVVCMNYENIPHGLYTIFAQAFSWEAGLGGILGGLLVGVQRAVFSNESGLGTAAIVYSAAKSPHPVTQGMASMLGPFLDTVVVCTVTALLIVITESYHDVDGVEGVALTSRALASGVSWFPYILAATVFLFAYSTLTTFAYYGVKCLDFLFGQHDVIEIGFKIVYCAFIIIGSSMQLSNLINFTDAMMLSMAFPNLIGLYVLAPEIKRELKDYLQNLRS